jgi:glycosyltransferase involved in cell wall biosynthesis
MPAFKAERFIDAALGSVRAQSHAELEIIVVDDASPDGTAGRVQTHVNADSRVRLLRLPANRGQCAAANHGLAHARGDHVKFFDADDLLSPDFVSVQLAALRERPRHLAYAAWGRFYCEPAEAVFTPHPGWHHSNFPLEWLLETWLDTEPMYQCALFLIPRPLLDLAGGWDERLSLINDFEFFSRLVLASGGIAFTPNARLFYRSGLPGSLSNLKSRKGCESACLSTMLGTRHLLAREDSPRTRRASADMLRANVHAFYPMFPDLLEPVETEIARLGGSRLRPQGGRAFRLVSGVFGWRVALRIRRALAQ